MSADIVTTITNAVDFSSILLGIGTVAASVMLILVSIRGARSLFKLVS